MEEKAKNRINLNAATEDGFRKEVDKLSYEQLKELAIQSTNQARKMYQDLQMAQSHEFIARINFLFKVLEFAKYFEDNYVRGCSAEISRVLELPEEEGVAKETNTPTGRYIDPEPQLMDEGSMDPGPKNLHVAK